MKQRGIELNLAFVRTAAEEVHRPAAAHHAHCKLPRIRLADGFNRDIHAAALGKVARGGNQVFPRAGIQKLFGSHAGRAFQLRRTPAHRDHARAVDLRQPHKHQADRAQPDHGNRVARPDGSLFQTAHHAGQRLNQRRILIGDVGRNLVHIPLDDSAGDADVLGVSAVVE